MSKSNIIIKDPLYKQILLSSELKKYLDCKEFQRLRNIKQTSFVDMVYPNANHTRFSHSLGVYHLMKKMLDNGLNDIDSKSKKNLLLAALLHDIGHGPFSHIWERTFPQFNHEETTMKILEKKGLKDVADILRKKKPFWQLISSTIDVDKLDYMARDSYFAGVSYGVAEVDFIIQHTYIKDDKIVIKKSALSSVEDLITQRVNLFKTVYFHKIAMEYDFIFDGIFKRVRWLLEGGIEIYVNSHLMAFFEGRNNLDDLQALNDVIVLAQIHEWSEHKDKILSDLCKRFINRDKFKVVNMHNKKVDLKKVQKKVAEKYDVKYYFGHIKLPINILQTSIYVESAGDKLKKLEEVSELIKFYKTQKWNVEFVIYPEDIEM